MVNFIGIGAQKAGTSWVYACLYEHPEIHAPIKELHFFSRDRFEKGKEWYESHFSNAKEGQQVGEFSTSYLYSPETPARIAKLYPDVKLIAILRNPRDRAYSQYRNAIKAGEIDESVSYEEYAAEEQSVIAQGCYAAQIRRYYEHFPKEQVLILIYEDIAQNPAAFMRQIYEFIGVDPNFVPSMLERQINVARTPRMVAVERVMHHVSETLRKIGLDKLVWAVRKSGLPDMVRSANTKQEKNTNPLSAEAPAVDPHIWTDDIHKLSKVIRRDMTSEWSIPIDNSNVSR